MRPIDLQDNLAKAPLASREQQIQQSSADQAQRLGAMRLDDEHALDQTRPMPTDESEGPENRVDRENADGQGRRRREGRHREGAEDDDDAPARPSASPNSRDIDVVA